MIVALIKKVALALSNNARFYYGESWENNIFADEVKLPIVFLDAPVRGKDRILASGNVETTYDVILFFFDKSNLDDLQPDRAAVLASQYAAKREFIIRLQNEKDVNEILAGETTELYNVFNRNVDGIQLKLKLTWTDARPVCLDKWLIDKDGNYVLDQNGNKIKA